MCDSEQTSMEILEEWIAGRGKHPVTWNTLIEVIYDIELSTLAREIEATKLPKDFEDIPEVTEDSSRRTVGDTCTTKNSDARENFGLSIGPKLHAVICELISYFETEQVASEGSECEGSDKL